jgi:large subunit ribosomal protein L30
MQTAIRIRGKVNVSHEINYTLQLLGIARKNHLVLIPKEQEKMMQKTKSYITYGEINKETLAKLLKKRGKLTGNKPLTEKYLKEKNIKDYEELAQKIIEEQTTLKKLGIKKVFRLKPPTKGFGRKGIKKTFKEGGALGNRGKKINELIQKMM